MSNQQIPLYPLRFQEAYKQTIWGGNRIYQYKGTTAPAEGIGETWEISPMEGDASVVSEGALKGKSLIEVTEAYGSQLLGQQVFDRFGGKFPLLVKLIDSNQDLSVQVHPNDSYAEVRHDGSWGKTEMWYILEHTKEAQIRAGWRKQTNPTDLPELVKTDEVMQYLDSHTAHVGDVFYLPAGKVHTIGAGNLLLEIQQASKITYRLFDFNRKDAQGNTRELHIEDAAKVIDYSINDHGAEPYDRTVENHPILLAESPYFRTSLLQLTDDYHCDLSERDSFTILFVEEDVVVVNGEVHLEKGQFLLLPACIHQLHLATTGAKVVESYVPKV